MKWIFLSFGHFGKGTGAFCNIGGDVYDEGVMTKDLVGMFDPHLFLKKTTERTLSEVVRSVNKTRHDLAIEFHFNAGGGTGAECVVSDKASMQTRNIAGRLSRLIADTLGIRDRGVKDSSRTPRGRLAFVDSTKCPAIIVEVAFVDCADDMARYKAKKTELAAKIETMLKLL